MIPAVEWMVHKSWWYAATFSVTSHVRLTEVVVTYYLYYIALYMELISFLMLITATLIVFCSDYTQ